MDSTRKKKLYLQAIGELSDELIEIVMVDWEEIVNYSPVEFFASIAGSSAHAIMLDLIRRDEK